MGNMKKNVTRIGAAGFVAALLAGGTYSALLWQDEANMDAATVVTGNLDIETVQTEAFDISDDRADNPHAIDLETFRIVPGDTIRIDNNVELALDGDNAVAELNTNAFLDALVADGADPSVASQINEYVEVGVLVTDLEGNVLDSATTEDGQVYRFHSPLQGGTAEKGGTLIENADIDAASPEANFNVQTTVTFSEDTPDRVLAGGVNLVEAAETGVTFTQVRDGEGFTESP